MNKKILTKRPVQLGIAVAVAALLFVGEYAWQSKIYSSTKHKAEVSKTMPTIRTGYALVNGLNMYYEIHGSSTDNGLPPLVLLHGAFMNLHNAFDSLMPELARTREVIAFDEQGHGRTADIDRPISQVQMADDAAETP